MNQPEYFEIISSPHFLDKFIERAFISEGFSPIPAGADDNRTVIFIASSPDDKIPDHRACDRLIIIATQGCSQIAKSAPAEATVIITPYIVGTGMTGLMRDIVAMTGRGTMFHIEGNDAQVSVIHAIDVARLAVALSDHSGQYSVSDGSDPSWRDLTEALSVRVGHKRIPTLSKRMARWAAFGGKIWGGPDRDILNIITTDATINPSPLPIDFSPTVVTEYLTNHEYTDEDL
ncbi:MAG: hypothetical protein HDS81_03685 [Bacteroidales bacterium]|nr:hypothetical protein [Bacteroidales bacterium]MBD5344529.1 hypothetical protein [Bacteroides sp.]